MRCRDGETSPYGPRGRVGGIRLEERTDRIEEPHDRARGPAPRVAEKVLEIRWGTASLLVGAIAGTVFDHYLGRRLKPGEIDR